MTPVIPCSTNSVTLFQGSTSVSRKNYHLTRSSLLHKSTGQILSSQCLIWPRSTSTRIFTKYKSSHGSRVHILAAAGTDVAVEEPSSAVAGEAPPDGTPSVAEEATAAPSAQSKRPPPRPVRKSDMPPVKNEDLVPGATFTGKVRSIQPFGAFVDFGAFTDGLVHVSQLKDGFVKEVGDVVSLGQEVKVKLVEANIDSKRISLTMRLDGDVSKLQQRREGAGGEKPRANQKSTKLVKGQDLQGTVKTLNRAGAFITLPEGEEGFLPTSEEYNGGFESMIEGSSLQIGEEVSVRVLRIMRGKVTLTMKKEEEITESNKVIQGVVHVATNPFAQAFRQNKEIAAFLDESQKSQKTAQAPVEEKISKTEVSEEVEESSASAVEDVVKDDVTSAVETEEVETPVPSSTDTVIDEASPEEAEKEVEASVTSTETAPTEPPSVDEKSEDPLPETPKVVDAAEETTPNEVASESLTPDESVLPTDEVKEDVVESTPEVESADQTVAPESVISGEVQVDQTDDTPSTIEKEISSPVENEEVKDEPIPSPIAKEEAKVEPTPSPAETEEVKVEPIPSPTTNEAAKVEPTPSEDSSSKASISPALVKSLRDETGAGMMDCKKALAETGGDIVKAQEFLRKKGLASADKKASRVTAEGRIGSYIHDSRIGVLIEVNCETDFVSRGDIFKGLVDDLAMQVAACPQVQYLVTEDVDEDLVNKEREIEMQKEDLLSKPEQIRAKIVEGRIRKRLEELALLEQPYIKNDKMVVKDWVKQTIATIGENIKVKRFVRYNLGEGLEKKSQDFAAEVAAQTAAKPPPVSQPAAAEPKEADERPKVTISAALVKELREETGAGMMDCKKALAETGGDLEKAQEYLRKKGLSSADKKSSRLAAEGRIGSYIHDARIGVLIEVNSETDFVGRSEKFKELVDDLAMQVVACPLVEYVSVEDIPASIVAKEKELEMQREDLQSKPVNIREKIVEGRISKRLGQLALLEQPFIKDDSVLIKDLVKNTIAAIGENIKVRRFVRFTLGETLDDVKETTTEA